MRILLVDDEPFFIENLKKRISQIGTELQHSFEIVAECYTAQLALERIVELHPDAVFTDIRMSTLDGIELAKMIHKRCPQIPVVLISAYPTFEYAREAMRANVADYLLKPLDLVALKEVLQKLLHQNQNKVYLQKETILRNIISSNQETDLPDTIQQMIFPFSSYRALLVQNVEAIYDTRLLMPKYEVEIVPFLLQLKEHLDDKEQAWTLPSDDRRSTLVVLGMYKDNPDKLKRLLQITQTYFSNTGISPTIVYSESFNRLPKLNGLVQQLRTALVERIIIGKPQLILLHSYSNKSDTHFSEIDEKRIVSLLSKRDSRGLQNFLVQLILTWEKKECTSIIVEMNLKRIVHLLEYFFRVSNITQSKKLETRIEELVYTAHTFSDLSHTFVAVLMSTFHIGDVDENASDSKGLFAKIELYISNNIGESLSLQLLTDHFNVSRTVLCSLFRDYSGKSFVEYVTSVRMKMAQELMESYPDMLNKDIAEIVGYSDQSYFSNVFKTIIGMSPTEYRANLTKHLDIT